MRRSYDKNGVVNMEIGTYIRQQREQQGLSKYELAKRAGVSQTTISKWENNENGINLETADKVLKILGVNFTIGAES